MKKVRYVIDILLISILAGCGSGNNSGKKNKTEEIKDSIASKEDKPFELSNKNVIKWYDLKEKKIDNYIKDKIVGEWSKQMTLNYLTEDGGKEIKLNRQVRSDKVNFEEGGFFKTPKFSIQTETKAGHKESNGYYLVNKNTINFKTTEEDYSETVIYVSDNLLITKILMPEINLFGFDFYSRTKESVKFNEELSQILLNKQKNAYMTILNASHNINTQNNIGAYTNLMDGYAELEFTSKLDTLIDLSNDDVILELKTALKEKFDDFSNNQLAKIEKEYSKLKINTGGFDVFKDLSNKVNELNTLEEIAQAFNLNDTKIVSLKTKLSKDYKELSDEYAIYGNADEFLLKSASEYFLEMNAKDPSSIEFIDGKVLGKNQKGLVYKVNYRGKNSFGALVINSTTFIMHYDMNNSLYNVVDYK